MTDSGVPLFSFTPSSSAQTDSGISLFGSIPSFFAQSDSGFTFGGSKPSLSAQSDSGSTFGGSKPSLSARSDYGFTYGGSKPSLSAQSDSGSTFGGSNPSLSARSDYGFTYGGSKPSLSAQSDSGSTFGGSKPSLSARSDYGFTYGGSKPSLSAQSDSGSPFGSKPSLSSVSGSAFNLGGSKPSLSSLSDSGFTFDGSKPSLSGVPYTDQTNTNSCEINAESGHGTTSTAEVLSNLQKVNIEEEIAGKESNNTNEVSPLTPSCIKKEEEAREANPEAAKTSSLMVISRILKGIPQDPHFYQLRNHSELARKIMICSWDQIFLETAEKIHSLQPNGFWVRARELWKTMEELQSMGYNVIPLRRRLVELTNVMTDLKLFKSNIKGLKIKAEDHRAEKRRLKFVILSLQEIIMGEEEGMERVVAEVMDLEKELPKFDEAFANLALEPL
ncbi:nucleoporin NUP116/NSP116 isoform X25 [Manihot esculenta]|uniref:nucleoporin NUP116/NSP116 isoform X25 n=1 Tax=Manihot esculenta TaxID=3983 RepID=UPI001CC7A808|nr:nucleoporin NUP116/NSP116 isoform X25 [Manihot esculenta]